MPVSLGSNGRWINKDTRPSCKYSPVNVLKPNSDPEKEALAAIVTQRVERCQELAFIRKPELASAAWFGFLHDQMRERNLRPHNVPVFVLSGGNAGRLKTALETSGRDRLAWHPASARNEPVYLFVHKSDYRTYQNTLSAAFAQYRNLFLVGWDGGELTGFGAARAAVLAYADCLPYAPQQLLMMDQDVVEIETTRHTAPGVKADILKMHETTGKPLIGYGVGYSTRATEFPTKAEQFKDLGTPDRRRTNKDNPSAFTPTQQFVSIKAPFRTRDDGVYPAFMVAGGEDMLMTQTTGSYRKDAAGKTVENVAIRHEKIFKKTLTGDGDTPNLYWTEDRIKTLDKLFEVEKDISVKYSKRTMTLGALCEEFVRDNHITRAEISGTSALIVERMILRAYQDEGSWPAQYSGTVLNKRKLAMVEKPELAE